MHPTTKPSARTEKQVAVLRAHALAYPDTREDFPWGHSAFKVRDKAFAFLHADAEGLSISVKLPESNALALELPFVEPTGYGLGKSGWVSARFAPNQDAPLAMLQDWLRESYAAIAPKRLVKQLETEGPQRLRKPAPKAASKTKKAASKTKKAASKTKKAAGKTKAAGAKKARGG
jgi:predicted DNA-binding protein (MmcQ/YjbR family)